VICRIWLAVRFLVVKDILKQHLHRRFAKSKLTGLEYIVIDEINVRKGHKYLTLVMDLCSGKVVFVGDGQVGESVTGEGHPCPAIGLAWTSTFTPASAKMRRMYQSHPAECVFRSKLTTDSGGN
jgi:hypothetical protein